MVCRIPLSGKSFMELTIPVKRLAINVYGFGPQRLTGNNGNIFYDNLA